MLNKFGPESGVHLRKDIGGCHYLGDQFENGASGMFIQEFEKISNIGRVGFFEDVGQVHGGIPAQKSLHRVLKQLISSLGHCRCPARQVG
jgi:hypothetical protein